MGNVTDLRLLSAIEFRARPYPSMSICAVLPTGLPSGAHSAEASSAASQVRSDYACGLGTGTRYFDTAPMYGAGLAQIRLGKYLAQHHRNDYVLSTKVGRLILDEATGACLDRRCW